MQYFNVVKRTRDSSFTVYLRLSSDNHPERASVSSLQRYQLSHEGPERDERLGQNRRG